MNSNILALIRMLLSGFGAFLLGKNLFGATIDESLWQMIVGSAMILISFLWSIFSKTSTTEMIEGFARQLITALGGLLTGLGVVKEETYQLISGIVTSLLPYILSLLGKHKNQEIAQGTLGVKDLVGVSEIEGAINPVTNTPKNND